MLSIRAVAFAGCLLCWVPVAANDFNQWVSNAEIEHGIPSGLLWSVLTHESRHPQTGQAYPWALNIDGYSHYPASRLEAYREVLRAKREGIKRIGVGYGQLEVRWHKPKETPLWQMLEPRFNVDYSGEFLAEQYRKTGDWRAAVGRYHSRTPSLAKVYIGHIEKLWDFEQSTKLDKSDFRVLAKEAL